MFVDISYLHNRTFLHHAFPLLMQVVVDLLTSCARMTVSLVTIEPYQIIKEPLKTLELHLSSVCALFITNSADFGQFIGIMVKKALTKERCCFTIHR